MLNGDSTKNGKKVTTTIGLFSKFKKFARAAHIFMHFSSPLL